MILIVCCSLKGQERCSNLTFFRRATTFIFGIFFFKKIHGNETRLLVFTIFLLPVLCAANPPGPVPALTVSFPGGGEQPFGGHQARVASDLRHPLARGQDRAVTSRGQGHLEQQQSWWWIILGVRWTEKWRDPKLAAYPQNRYCKQVMELFFSHFLFLNFSVN